MTTGRDLQKATEAMQRIGHQMNQMAYRFSVGLRPMSRIGYTRGDRHIERVCKEILAGKPGRPAHIRLEAAVGFAEVLDRQP